MYNTYRWEWVRQNISFQVPNAVHSNADASRRDKSEEPVDRHQPTAGGFWQRKDNKEQQCIKICKSDYNIMRWMFL